MGFRKIKAKKYNGIYEYFKDSDPDKSCVAYYIAYRDIENKTKKVKSKATSKEQALQILNEIKAQVTKDKAEVQKDKTLLRRKVMNSNLTLDDVAKIYYDVKEIKDIRKQNSTYRLHISPVLGTKKINSIKTSDLIDLSTALKQKKIIRGAQKGTTLNERTVKKIISNLRALYNWAIREGYLTTNPVVLKDIIKVNPNEVGRVLTDKELQKLWSLDEWQQKPRLYLFLKTCYLTGARPGGVITIQVKHINFNSKTIHIRAMKSGKPYDAKVNDELLALLKERITEHKLTHDNYIFYPEQLYTRAITTQEKEEIKNTHTRYQKYASMLRTIFNTHFNQNIGTYDMAYRCTVYTMRRTAATNVYKKLGIVHAKKFLNHTEIDTTMKYLNIDSDIEVVDYGL